MPNTSAVIHDHEFVESGSKRSAVLRAKGWQSVAVTDRKCRVIGQIYYDPKFVDVTHCRKDQAKEKALRQTRRILMSRDIYTSEGCFVILVMPTTADMMYEGSDEDLSQLSA